MTITIGRFTGDKISAVTRTGDKVRVQGLNQSADTSERLAKMHQVAGLVDDLDDPIIPVTSTDRTDLNGFYRVIGVQVSEVRKTASADVWRWQAELERVGGGFADPAIETSVANFVATNSHGETDPTGMAVVGAYPDTNFRELDFSGLPVTVAAQNSLGDGNLPYTSTGGDFVGSWFTYGDPATYYDAPSCVFEVLYGSTWHPVVGRQLPSGFDGWRIHNYYQALIIDGDSGGTDYVSVAVVDTLSPLTWSRYDDITTGEVSAGSFSEIGGVAHGLGEAGPFILRNSPETIVVATTFRAMRYTWTLRMGEPYVTLNIRSSGDAEPLGIGVETTAATTITGGTRSTGTNGDGNRLVILGRSAVTGSTTGVGVEGPSTDEETFMISVNGDGAAQRPILYDANLLAAFCSPPHYSRRIVSR